ncbi:hypothetical protein [Absidia glauca]|uniref:Cytochrome P450 n=1 Tax=Absidia glauca TaxID=4829 RepID=A0A168SQ09_ABSGL|nr:hypothetical protein [Absidia glauca]
MVNFLSACDSLHITTVSSLRGVLLFGLPALFGPYKSTSWSPTRPLGTFFRAREANRIEKRKGGEKLHEWAVKYGSVYRIFVPGNKPYIFVSDPGLLKHILSNEETDFAKPPELKKFISRVLGDGILNLDGNAHRHQRKLVYPSVGLKAVREMVPSILLPTQQLVHRWWKRCSSSPSEVNVSEELVFLTMESIGNALFGQKFDCMNNPKKNRLCHAFLTIAGLAHPKINMLIMTCPWLLYLPIPRVFCMNWCLSIVRAEARAMVIDASQKPDVKEKKDLLSLLVQNMRSSSGNGLTVDEIRDECVLFLGAGNETTNAAISFALYELAQNQDLQDQLRQEVRQIFHSLSPEDECPTDMPCYDDINKLPLLSNVFKETLRCYSTVPFGAKIAEKDFVWNNKVFTKGTRFLVSSLVNHFDKSQWGDDCNQYIPSRWDCTPAKNIGQYAYFPFGSGPRSCVVAILIKNFKFTPKPGFELRTALTISLRPIGGIPLIIERAQ